MTSNGRPFRAGDGRAAERSRGGRSAQARRRAQAHVRVVAQSDLPGELLTLDDAVRWAAWLTSAVGSGRIDSRTGDVMFRGLRTFTDGRAKLDRADERIRKLNEQIAALRRSMEDRR